MAYISRPQHLEAGRCIMEKFIFTYSLTTPPIQGKRTVCGVVGSGNLEVIVEGNTTTTFEVATSVGNFQAIWQSVIDDFVNEYHPAGLKFILNDNGATPFTVSLRLRQAIEQFQTESHIGSNHVELDARKRIISVLDEHSFKEWLAEDYFYSPHLAALGLPCQADDGLVIGSGTVLGKTTLIAAQQKDFMGGAVGELHGAKLTGLFYRAIELNVNAVVLLIDSGGVRLQEANAGEIAISEIIRAVLLARQHGIVTVGIVCGKNGAYGGMGIISTCLDYLIVNEVARIGVSGAEVIQTVKGVEAFDARDHALVWRVYGGRTRYLQQVAAAYVHSDIISIRNSLQDILKRPRCSFIDRVRQDHELLMQRLEQTQGYQEEGAYLAKDHPELVKTIFEMNSKEFLVAARQLLKNGD